MRRAVDGLKETLAPVFERYRGRISAAYLFGSSARGEHNSRSDIDLAILLAEGSRESGVELRLDLYADCSRALKRNDIDIVAMNRTRNLFLLEEIVREGIVLYDLDTEFRKEFEVKVQHQFIEFRDHRRRILGV